MQVGTLICSSFGVREGLLTESSMEIPENPMEITNGDFNPGRNILAIFDILVQCAAAFSTWVVSQVAKLFGT